MDNRKVIYKLAIASALAISIVGCKPKYDEIDNNQVISKPYVLFVGDSSGRIAKTNDGFSYETVFAPDNYPVFSMVTSGNNMLFIKKNVHVIADFGHGNNSNPSLILPGGPQGFDKSYMICVPAWGNRVYVGGFAGSPFRYNDSNGRPEYMTITNWLVQGPIAVVGGAQFTSFTFLSNNTLVGFDNATRKFYTLSDGSILTGAWANAGAGAGLPPAGHDIFISHISNTILAADTRDSGKLYYSTDNGANFQAYTGLPANVKILSVDAPFDQTILVGTKSHGIFRLPLGSTQFVSSSLGLASNSTVPCITGKYDYFKNSRSKQYVYAATSKGIYRSEDLGENWTKVYDGNFVSLY